MLGCTWRTELESRVDVSVDFTRFPNIHVGLSPRMPIRWMARWMLQVQHVLQNVVKWNFKAAWRGELPLYHSHRPDIVSFPFRLHRSQSEDSSLVSVRHNQKLKWQHKCSLQGNLFLKNKLTNTNLWISQSLSLSTVYLTHLKYGCSANPSTAHCLSHTSCWLDVRIEIEWLDWFSSWKAFQTWTNKKWALRALKSGFTFDGLCCDSKASSSQFCVIIQVLLCKINRPFLHHSSYSICPWNCCNSVVPAGERFHRTSSWS